MRPYEVFGRLKNGFQNNVEPEGSISFLNRDRSRTRTRVMMIRDHP